MQSPSSKPEIAATKYGEGQINKYSLRLETRNEMRWISSNMERIHQEFGLTLKNNHTDGKTKGKIARNPSKENEDNMGYTFLGLSINVSNSGYT